MTKIALRHRKGRPDARHATLAFKRFDQRCFLTADVGTGTHMDFDIEVKTSPPADVLAEQAAVAACLQIGEQCRQQIMVFAAQVKQAMRRIDREASHRHAIKNKIGVAGEQNAILEGSRLAFIGIAHHVARRMLAAACRLAGRRPLDRRRKARTATPAQICKLDFRQHRLRATRHGRPDRLTRRPVAAQQHIAPANIVRNGEILGRPVVERRLRTNQFADAVNPLTRHAAHRPAVNQQGRPLIAQPGARGGIDTDQAVFRDLAALKPQLVAQALAQFDAAKHAVGNVVGEKDAITPHRLKMQKGIEPRDALNPGARQAQRLRNLRQRSRRQKAQRILCCKQNLQQARRLAPMVIEHCRQHIATRICFCKRTRHAALQ